MTWEETSGSAPGYGEQAEGASIPGGRRPQRTPEEIRSALLAASPGKTTGGRAALPSSSLPQGSRTSGVLELILAITGVGLSAFMAMHMGLLSSVLLGAGIMDTLASFLERYYLLQAVAPLLILAIVVHVILALRKVPGSFHQQRLLLGVGRAMRHFDTFAWGVQLVSAVVIVALVSVHLWVLLTDLPIEAAKSGARVQGIYLWLYIPLLLAVESHISAGVYRIAVKWGINRRSLLHALLTLWTVLVLALGAAILVVFYRLGGSA